MQEKTLEEEFEEKFGNYFRSHYDEVGWHLLLSFISSREEKAREEGRKEVAQVYVKEFGKDWETKPVFEVIEMIRTQYKEELLLKLSTFEVKEIGLKYDDNVKDTVREIVGMTLSEVKKLLI